jgi:hypothetical protein
MHQWFWLLQCLCGTLRRHPARAWVLSRPRDALAQPGLLVWRQLLLLACPHCSVLVITATSTTTTTTCRGSAAAPPETQARARGRTRECVQRGARAAARADGVATAAAGGG